MHYIKPNWKLFISSILLLTPIYTVIRQGIVPTFDNIILNEKIVFLLSCVVSYLLSCLFFFFIHQFRTKLTPPNSLPQKNVQNNNGVEFILILCLFFGSFLVILNSYDESTKPSNTGMGILILVIISIALVFINSSKK